jgi:hypothetical protein
VRVCARLGCPPQEIVDGVRDRPPVNRDTALFLQRGPVELPFRELEVRELEALAIQPAEQAEGRGEK